jgi:hypothetical protein
VHDNLMPLAAVHRRATLLDEALRQRAERIGSPSGEAGPLVLRNLFVHERRSRGKSDA